MDFVEWCNLILNKTVEMSRSKPEAIKRAEVSDRMLATEFFGEEILNGAGYWESSYRHGVLDAMEELITIGMFEKKSSGNFINARVTQRGREFVADVISFWEEICSMSLDPQQEKMLRIVNRLSAQDEKDHAWLKRIERDDIVPEWAGDDNLLRLTASELHQIGFINLWSYVGPKFDVKAKYLGLVWETRRSFTLESKWIDERVKEWETTSVDFKRELYLDTASSKAEFVKDVIGLANTQASGQRWMIVGFDDKSRGYYGAPSADITQNRIEQLLAQYTNPNVDVKYSIVNYRAGQVGKLEVLRDQKKLPYSVAKSLGDKAAGDKKRIEEGQTFVRHGSQTEQPTPDGLNAIREEGERARS